MALTRQEHIGRAMFYEREAKNHSGPDDTFAYVADAVLKYYKFPDNRKDESIGTETAAAYLEELRNNPTKQAQELYHAIQTGEKVEEDPSGA